MSEKFNEVLSGLALPGLLARHKADDHLVLDDTTLLAAIDGSHPLNRSEWNALIDSPLTLKRFALLASQAERLETVGIDCKAANDDDWLGSRGLLLAADSATTAAALGTEDGWWRLIFLPAETGWSAVLKLDANAPFRARLLEAAPPLVVTDHKSRVLFSGVLDQDGELEATWPIAGDPYPYLMSAGGSFHVKPA